MHNFQVGDLVFWQAFNALVLVLNLYDSYADIMWSDGTISDHYEIEFLVNRFKIFHKAVNV